MPRKHIVVSGRVQGVGFRYHTIQLADACKLTGWVRNLDSGEVELEIQGKEEDMEKFFALLDKRSMFIRIDQIQSQDCEEIREDSFIVRY